MMMITPEHEEQYNCFIPCDVYKAFKRFKMCFIRMFPNEQKTSVRYTLYRIAQLLVTHAQKQFFLT